MRDSGRAMVLNGKNGFTALEILVALIVISILTAVSMKPVTGLLQRIKIQNSAEGIKHLILNARTRAVANPNRHCGVVILAHASTAINDTVFAFLENKGQDYLYTAVTDSLYGNPFIIDKKYKISAAIPAGFPAAFGFRGDGSANVSAKIVLTLDKFEDTISVLASTGKVKVIVK